MMQPEIRDQILRRIDAYDGSIKSLGRVIDELDAIWNAEDWQPSAEQYFYRCWLTTEEIYAVALNSGTTELSPRDQSNILLALAEIRPIIQKGP
jgi:hypothetical protein